MTEAKKEASEFPINQVLCGDCVEIMKTLPNESVDMTMFSPPYWGLRDYNMDKQIGLEPHPRDYIQKMLELSTEVKRLLRKSGSMYVVIGDTYFGSGTGRASSSLGSSQKQLTNRGFYDCDRVKGQIMSKPDGSGWLQPKQLLGIPWRSAIALQEDGWILRNDIIWNKPNHMPSSVKDRLTNAYEHIFHFVKNGKYYYDLDAIREKPVSVKASGNKQRKPSLQPNHGHVGRSIPWTPYQHKCTKEGTMLPNGARIRHGLDHSTLGSHHISGKNPSDVLKTENVKDAFFGHPPTNYYRMGNDVKGKNPGDTVLTKHDITVRRFPTVNREGGLSYADSLHVKAYCEKGKNPGDTSDFWNITTQPFKGAHFAVYPEQICVRPIKSSCPPDGIVLDPMCGSGTTLVVAKKLGRKYIGIELSPQYIEIAMKRLAAVPEKITTFF